MSVHVFIPDFSPLASCKSGHRGPEVSAAIGRNGPEAKEHPGRTGGAAPPALIKNLFRRPPHYRRKSGGGKLFCLPLKHRGSTPDVGSGNPLPEVLPDPNLSDGHAAPHPCLTHGRIAQVAGATTALDGTGLARCPRAGGKNKDAHTPTLFFPPFFSRIALEETGNA